MPEVRFRTADLIFHVCLESVTHNDNLEKFIVTKGNQPEGRGGGKLYGKRRRTAERV